MAELTAKIHISLQEGTLQIEGSEAFVEAQIARLEPHIVRVFEVNGGQASTGSAKGASAVKPNRDDAKVLANYDHVFAANNGRVQILKTLPGTNNAQKTINAGLLVAFAHELVGTGAGVTTDTVMDVCKAHACFDQSNFAGTLKRQRELFLLDGTGKTKSLRLSVPGRKKAEEMARQLNQA